MLSLMNNASGTLWCASAKDLEGKNGTFIQVLGCFRDFWGQLQAFNAVSAPENCPSIFFSSPCVSKVSKVLVVLSTRPGGFRQLQHRFPRLLNLLLTVT